MISLVSGFFGAFCEKHEAGFVVESSFAKPKMNETHSEPHLRHTAINARVNTKSFWFKVFVSKCELACWPFRFFKNHDGYGVLYWKGKNQKAHRVAYLVSKGEIPKGMIVCHACDNPSCCNPAHLFAGTPSDNSQDMLRKKRNRPASGDRNGMRKHPEMVLRGSESPVSKITEDDVREIRRLKNDGVPRAQIAARFKISVPNIQAVVQRRTWKHVP